MAKSYFQFKQFTVHQQENMMKICTDSCLFGAWVAKNIQDMPLNRILDIGTGTGVLALMVAQKTSAIISAVELHEPAFEQAKMNIRASPFANNISLYFADIRDWENAKFDFILTNPPFYERDLKSDVFSANLARHGEKLSFAELLQSIDKLLSKTGAFAILLPASREKEFKRMALQNGFHLAEKVMVKQTPRHDVFRAMLWFQRNETRDATRAIITIKNDENLYTNEFSQLLKDYYL